MKFKKWLNDQEWYNKWNYFVTFLNEKNEVVHVVGYEVRPDIVNLSHIFEELKVDKEFGMNSDYVDSLKVDIASKINEED